MALRQRSDLQALLLGLAPHAYFQPPPSLKMEYPCIVYNRSDIHADHADNAPYNLRKRYSVTVIDRDPDSTIPDLVAKLPTASFDRHFVNDNLNHDVFTLFF